MPQTPIDITTVNELWQFYKKKQSPKFVAECARRSGIKASKRTIYRLISDGYPDRGIASFKERLKDIQESTTQVVDQQVVAVAVADIDGWRRIVDQGQTLVIMLMARAKEILEEKQTTIRNSDGTEEVVQIPLDAKDLRAAAEAVKVAFSSMKQAAETHDIWNLQSGSEVDGWDMFLKEHVEEFTLEERAAFRDHGDWPDRIPFPEFLGGGEEKGDE